MNACDEMVNELEKYGIEEKKWNTLVDNLGLSVNNIIYAIQTACYYDELYVAFEDWIDYGDNIVAENKKKHNKYYNIGCTLDVSPFRNCGKEIDEDDCVLLELIWMICVLLYGDYGTAPCHGWIDGDKWGSCRDFLYVLVMHMQYGS